MASVWYIGPQEQRVITASDWSSSGVTGANVFWSKYNGWSVPEAQFTSQQLAILDNDPGFWLGQADGPRAGSNVVSQPNRPVTSAEFEEYKATTKRSEVRLWELFRPIQGTIPQSEIVSDSYYPNNPPGDYESMTGTRWDSPKLNLLGQHQMVKAANPANYNAGCLNKPTGRDVGSALDFEFILEGSRFSIHGQSFGYFDIQVYVEHEGEMKKLHENPWEATHDGFFFRDIKFTKRARRRIRIVMPFIFFVQILHETSSNVYKAPPKPVWLTDGDSFFDMSSAYVGGSAKTFATYGPSDSILECTGFQTARHGQGGTGYFNNATGVASWTPHPGGSTPFVSDDRLNSYKAHGKGTITVLSLNGTINDGELSGGKASMKARALSAYQKIHAWDPDILLVIIGPEPHNDPPVDGLHDLNRQGLQEAVAEHKAAGNRIVFVDPITDRWFWGTGSEVRYNMYDSASKLIGGDDLHGNYYMYDMWGKNTAKGAQNELVSAVRELA